MCMHALWGNIKILIWNWFGESISKYLPKSHFFTKKISQYWGNFPIPGGISFITLQLPWYWGISPVLGGNKIEKASYFYTAP